MLEAEGGFVLARARRDAELLRAVGRQVATLATAALTTSGGATRFRG